MVKRILQWFVAFSLLISVALPARLGAQESPAQKPQHHHYKLIDMGTFGGVGGGIVNPSAGALSNQGILVGESDTSIPDLFPNTCFTNCFVNRGFEWRNGVVTELPALPSGAGLSSIPSAVNAKGQAVGQAQNGDVDSITGWPETRAVIWQNGHILAIPTFGGTQGTANAINDRGQVVGAALTETPDPFANSPLAACGALPTIFPCNSSTFATASVFYPGTTETHAFLWHQGSLRDLGTLGGPDSTAWIINDRGEVAGWSFTSFVANPLNGVPNMDPFFWSPADGKMIDLGGLGGSSGAPFWMNNHGQVVGSSNLPGDNDVHPFLWDHGKMKDLGTLGGSSGVAYYVNDTGEVVGTSNKDASSLTFAFYWKNGVMKNLGTVDGDECSKALSINSKSQIVGVSDSCTTGFDLHGFLVENGEPIVDLNTLLPPNAALTVILAALINDRGEIGCLGSLPNGDTHACLLIPCDPEHPGIEGCDYSPFDSATAPQTHAAPALAPQPRLTAGEIRDRVRTHFARGRFALPRQ